MKIIIQVFSKRFDIWDMVCIDENLKLHVIMFSFRISNFFYGINKHCILGISSANHFLHPSRNFLGFDNVIVFWKKCFEIKCKHFFRLRI